MDLLLVFHSPLHHSLEVTIHDPVTSLIPLGGSQQLLSVVVTHKVIDST